MGIFLAILFSFVSHAEMKIEGLHAFSDFGAADKIISLGNNNSYEYYVGSPIGMGGGYQRPFRDRWDWYARAEILFAMRMDVYSKNGGTQSFPDSGIFDVILPSGGVRYNFSDEIYGLFGGSFTLPISDVAKSVNKSGALGWQLGGGYKHSSGCFFEIEYRSMRYYFRIEQEEYFDTTQAGMVIRGGYLF